MSSLKDQLLKAGLVNKKQVQQAQSKARKQEHDAKKNTQIAQQLTSERQQELEKIQEEKQQAALRDKELNRLRDLALAQRENYYRAQQSILSNKLNEKDATIEYYFAIGKVIKKIYVTAWQQELLARGQLAIAKPYEDMEEFILIPLEVAKVLCDIYPQMLVVLHNEISDNQELEEDF